MKIVGKLIGKNKCYLFYPLLDGSPSHPSKCIFSHSVFLFHSSWVSVCCLPMLGLVLLILFGAEVSLLGTHTLY